MNRSDVRPGNGFTLIEILVVIVVILILAGILFKLQPMVGRRAAESRCHAQLQQLRNALNEFYAEYGHYPPVNFVEYEYECSTNQTPWFRDVFLPAHNNPNDAATFFPDTTEGREPGDLGYATGAEWGGSYSLYYKYGLVSYLYPRARGDQRHWFDDDTARDAAAKAGWNHFIAGFDSSGGGPGYHINLQNEVHFTNEVATIKDPWSRTYQYRCPPPHIRFKLWSVGPDGVNNTVDDILYSNE